MSADDQIPSEADRSEESARLGLHRAVAVITPDSIAVRPSRAGWIGPLVQALLAAVAVWLIVAFINLLPLWVLAVLLLIVMISGPMAVLGLVYNVAGASFIVERSKGTARRQQGFLGLGLGTHELVPFARIKRIEVESDAEQRLSSGDRQDVVRWVVRLVKDNDREIEIGTVMAPRPLAREGAERANVLASAVARMAGADAQPAPVPEAPASATADGGLSIATAPRGRRRYRRVRGTGGAGTAGGAERGGQ